jgi:hypothetical protein
MDTERLYKWVAWAERTPEEKEIFRKATRRNCEYLGLDGTITSQLSATIPSFFDDCFYRLKKDYVLEEACTQENNSKKNDSAYASFTDQEFEMIMSLCVALFKAGGGFCTVNPSITLRDLAKLLAPNGVRFCYKGDKNE